MENEELGRILKKLDELDEKLTRQDERLKALEIEAASKAAAPAPTFRRPLPRIQQLPGGQRTVPRYGRRPVEKKKRDGNIEELGGRWFGHVGIFALVVGVAFFLKYAFNNNWVGEIGRVMIGIVSGVAIIGLGQYLRKKYLRYSDVLIGGGISILYLSIFSALSFYHLISSTTAFALMALVTLFAGVISVVDSSKTLAVIGILGGFMTPVLVSTGENRFYELFSYILLLDIGILGIALFKKWGRLNYIGFVGTIVMFAGWGDRFYTTEQLGRTLAFMSAFFVVYLFTSVMHHLVRKEDSEPADLALIVANAAIFSGAAYGMLTYYTLRGKYDDFLGFAALLLAVIYFAISHLAKKSTPDDKNLSLFLIGISIVFLTVAIPIQLTGHWITLAWLIEALILYYLSFMPLELKGLKHFGAVVYFLGLARLLWVDALISRSKEFTLIMNYRFFITLVAILVSYCVAYLFNKNLDEVEPSGEGGMPTLASAKKNAKTAVLIFALVANILTVFIITAETSSHYGRKMYLNNMTAREEIERIYEYNAESGNNDRRRNTKETAAINNEMYKTNRSLRYQLNTVVSVLWAIYAVILMAFGIFNKKKAFRIGGMAFFFITALKVFLEMWELGQLYRIISSITFGVIALAISFVYTKYKDKIKEFYEGET